MATMAEVIDEATKRYRALTIVSDPEIRGVRQHEYIAAAVAAHLLSEAVVERVTQAGYDWQCADWPDDWHLEEPGITPEVYTAKHMWPVMVAAALGEHEGEA